MPRSLVRAVPLTLALGALALGASACKPPPSAGDAGDGSATVAAANAGPAPADAWRALARAEDSRSAKDVPEGLRTAHDVAARRRSARALARIADAASLEGLGAHLADDDPETLAWGAYGLGYACKGHEDAHVKMLVARAASLSAAPAPAAPSVGRGVAELDPRTALARAIGRCGGANGEASLAALLKQGGGWTTPALLGLGDLATRKKQLSPETTTALLDRVARETDSDAVFYALSRADGGEAFGKRVQAAAAAALARPGDHRILAIKTVGRAGKELAREAVTQLARVLADPSGFTPAERAEAARALGGLGEVGAVAAGDALGRLVPDKDAAAIEALVGPELHVLYTLVGALGAEPPKKSEPVLRAVSNLKLPTEPRVALGRRLAQLRCAAALGLARGGYDAEVLQKCDVETSEISEQARLASLLRRPLTGERRAAFRAFAKSPHLRVREAAVEAIAQHPELGDAAAPILADALASKKPGLVATAAEVIDGHPDRALVLAASEKRAALDPKAPPPTADPLQEVSPDVGRALAGALAEAWPEDRFETRIAVIEAAAAIRHPQAKTAAATACIDANPVVRERAQKALRTLGEKVDACNATARVVTPAAELGAPVAGTPKLVLTLDDAEVAPLTVVLEPELSPITAARLASLARSGFFKGIVVHRVVPGFVVQLGDPDGDGYGGSGTPLRCETSPVPFAPLDVGMALAGRDTGSSQIFVTLARTPHLDGEYTRVGRAEGPWASVAQGDVVTDARLVE